MKKLIQNFVITLVTLFCLFWMLDIFVRDEVLYMEGVMTDSSFLNKEAWLERKHFDSKMEGYVNLYDHIDLFDDTLGWVPKPFMPNSQGMYTTIQDGIRSEVPISKSKPDSVYRILTIGDSFTWGEEVVTSETFQVQAEKQLKNVEIVNIGVHGYGHDQILLRLEKVGLKYKPNLVVLGCVNEDLARNGVWFRDYYKPKMDVLNGKLTLQHVPILKPEETINSSKYRNKTFNYIRARVSFLQNSRESENSNSFMDLYELNYLLLDSINKLCIKNEIDFVMVYFPPRKECLKGKSAVNVLYSNFAREKGIPLLDFTKKISLSISNSKIDKKVIANKYSHWHPIIHKFLADEIVAYLINEKGLSKKND